MMGCDGALIGFAGTATAQLVAMHACVAARDYASAFATGTASARWRASAGARRSATIARG